LASQKECCYEFLKLFKHILYIGLSRSDGIKKRGLWCGFAQMDLPSVYKNKSHWPNRWINKNQFSPSYNNHPGTNKAKASK
jgi:hypothetical protein